MEQAPKIVHATTVAVDGKGILIIGPSGAGKSSLALQLIALGADLVADDRTRIFRADQVVFAEVPETIAGMIEARGVGILRVAEVGQTPLALVVDLSVQEQQRLPEPRFHSILGVQLPCFYSAPSPHFAIAIWLYVRSTLDISS